MTTTLDDLRAGDLSTDQLAHYLAVRRAREQHDGPTYTDEERRLRDQARVIRVAGAMVIEDGFPGELVVEALIAERPQYSAGIREAVAGAVAELAGLA